MGSQSCRSCASAGGVPRSADASRVATPQGAAWAEHTRRSLSLEQNVAQLLVAELAGGYVRKYRSPPATMDLAGERSWRWLLSAYGGTRETSQRSSIGCSARRGFRCSTLPTSKADQASKYQVQLEFRRTWRLEGDPHQSLNEHQPAEYRR